MAAVRRGLRFSICRVWHRRIRPLDGTANALFLLWQLFMAEAPPCTVAGRLFWLCAPADGGRVFCENRF